MNYDAIRKYFNEQAVLPQKLGTVDCVNFVTEAVYLGWGRDYRAILQYDSRRSAVARLRELGGLQAACSYAMGSMHLIEDLEPGDVIWYEKPVATLGLFMPGYVAVKMGRTICRLRIQPHLQGWKT
jgi:Domain of unknown function (DUF6950)